jgi:hypothetical protein
MSLPFDIPRARKQQFFFVTFVIFSSLIVRAGGPLPPKPFEEMDDEEFIEWKISTGYKIIFLTSPPTTSHLSFRRLSLLHYSTSHSAQRVSVLPVGPRRHSELLGAHAKGAFVYYSLRSALRGL